MTDTFTCTSDAPYDRHTYRIYLKNGKSIDFDYWEQVQEYWFMNSQIPDYLGVIEVVDKLKYKENKKKKGFS